MTLYKNVNGIQVECSEEEEQLIVAQWEANKAKQQATAWLNGRRSEYPQISDQLDMLWHAMDADEIPGKGIEWYNTIKAIKEKYLKPEGV